LNRPERLNTLDHALYHALLSSLNDVARDKTARVVVLTGAGRAFCAGADPEVLHSMRDRLDLKTFEELLSVGKKTVLAIIGMAKPVLACVNGPAAGAGFNLALACDLRIASHLASFSQSSAKVGLLPAFGGACLLRRLVGPARSAELLYTGETISAEDGAAMGLSRVVPHDRLADETAVLANRLAASPPLAVHGTKQTLSIDHRENIAWELDEGIRWQLLCFRSEDCREGLAAFFEKRPPRFRGL